MDEEPNPIKDYLFEYLDKSKEKNLKLISENKISNIIDDVLTNCYDKIISLGEKEESLGTLATGLLHYLLTNTLLASQRKISHQGIEIDIVLPDLKTLLEDAKNSLIICIPKTLDKKVIETKLHGLEKIQPQKNNIWLVLTKDLGLENKTYVIQKENSSFSKIIYDVAQFVNVKGQNKFKILKV